MFLHKIAALGEKGDSRKQMYLSQYRKPPCQQFFPRTLMVSLIHACNKYPQTWKFYASFSQSRKEGESCIGGGDHRSYSEIPYGCRRKRRVRGRQLHDGDADVATGDVDKRLYLPPERSYDKQARNPKPTKDRLKTIPTTSALEREQKEILGEFSFKGRGKKQAGSPGLDWRAHYF